jgi:GntR family transcriptional regulator
VPQPMYRQIAEQLLREIEAGDLAPGEQLKTEIELREQYGASRNTVRDAIKWLISRGLVETRPGQGTFVVQRTDPFVFTLSGDAETGDTSEVDVYISNAKSEGRDLLVAEPRVEIQRASGELASQLGLDAGQPVISRRQQLTIDSVPWLLQTTFYPMEFVTDGALRLIETVSLEGGAIAYLREAIEVEQAGWRDFIMARTPDRTETAFFGLPDNGQVPVFEIRRTGFDNKGKAMWLAVTVYPADRNRFVYEEGSVPAPASPPTTNSLVSEDTIILKQTTTPGSAGG